MQPINFEEALGKILAEGSPYHQEAYFFVREALDYTQKAISKANKGKIRHISGQELLGGIRAYALTQYGPMTLSLFEEWGVRRCEDFGEIVFQLVEHGVLSKTETDQRADFAGGYGFAEAFRDPYVPANRRSTPPPESKPAEA